MEMSRRLVDHTSLEASRNWSIASLETNGRGMEQIGDWSSGADDA